MPKRLREKVLRKILKLKFLRTNRIPRYGQGNFAWISNAILQCATISKQGKSVHRRVTRSGMQLEMSEGGGPDHKKGTSQVF